MRYKVFIEIRNLKETIKQKPYVFDDLQSILMDICKFSNKDLGTVIQRLEESHSIYLKILENLPIETTISLARVFTLRKFKYKCVEDITDKEFTYESLKAEYPNAQELGCPDIKIEKEQISQEIYQDPYKRYNTSSSSSSSSSNNKPCCPHCKSTNFSKIGYISKSISIGTLGIVSNSIGKTFKCNKCGYKW